MPYLGLKVKARNKGEIKLPSPCRNNQIFCAVNCRQDASSQAPTDVKQPFLPYSEPDLCNDYILKDPEYIDRFCINFPCHCVLEQVHLYIDLLNNVVLRKEVVQPTKKPRSVGPHKSKPEKMISRKNTVAIRRFLLTNLYGYQPSTDYSICCSIDTYS